MKCLINFKVISIYALIFILQLSAAQQKKPVALEAIAVNQVEHESNLEGGMMKPNIDISIENRKKSVEVLNILLADEFVLYTKLLNYHWNVEGMFFNDLHSFFNNQYAEVQKITDSVAERVRSIGFYPIASMQEFMKHTRLQEGNHTLSDKDMIKDLLKDHESIIRKLRVDQDAAMSQYKDAGTSNFLLGLLEKHEKMAWMLRAFLNK